MDQSSTPWRVFDAPSSPSGAAGAGDPPATSGAPSPVAGVPQARLALVGVGAAVVIGALAVAIALAGSGGQVVEAPPDRALPGSNEALKLAGAGEVVVDVTGAVAKPGVYRLPAGSRVADAIATAGGFSPRVDADRVASALNLAAALMDGTQVHVPTRGEQSGSVAEGTGSSTGGTGAGSAVVNLNTASRSELEALPGIGPVTAAKIIESRTTSPFASVDELRARKLVGEKTFEQLRTLVTVG